jgi:antitoxin component YwqK of YwqJK toxin-antitoxin module
MNITKVVSNKDKKTFLQVPIKIYRNDKNWIRPLDKDINSVFSKAKNKAYRNGDVIRWLLTNNDEVIGRIAAFYSNKNIEDKELKVGGCGFFECINNQEAANLLFDTAKDWLNDNGYNSMDGPINFGERDKWWGCLFKALTSTQTTNRIMGKIIIQNYLRITVLKFYLNSLHFLKKLKPHYQKS